ncbi:hypothetical protein [Cupriavidus sp. U2]|uniref:hypothetical protein n=1 Tax=Cupriavidus sp. U2 TaxID=2920269 RepID=UPI00129D9E8C|nr:hypothetical protein [Cupriavidus sp. U2]
MQHVALCRAMIRRQITLIRRLQRRAEDTGNATKLPASLLDSLTSEREHLRLIQQMCHMPRNPSLIAV